MAGPPRLRFRVREHFRLLLALNILPLLLAVYLLVAWLRGDIGFRALTGEETLWLEGGAACAIVLALGGFFIWPLADWLAAWPRWHYRHRSRVLWLLPWLLGAALGALLKLTIIAGVVLILVALLA